MGIVYEESRANRTLRIECNEIGFSRNNVEAICSLSESSKPQPGRQREYIGEKGMGFKSVFAVADVVIIRSGYYSFKFVNDKSEPLAMIVPHWMETSRTEPLVNTSITLQLSREFSPRNLVKKLRSMDPAFLMFLKKLQKVNIELNHEKSTQNWVWKRSDFSAKINGLTNVGIYQGEETTEYAVLRKRILDLPQDERRSNNTETDLKLVYPIRSSSRLVEERASFVYAFLPVRDYGFEVRNHKHSDTTTVSAKIAVPHTRRFHFGS
jgi:hypothetical protein